MENLVTKQRQTADCGKPVINIKGSGECNNGFVYTGSGTVLSGSVGVTPFPYNYNLNILGNITRKPRKIDRAISKNCTTQKTTSSAIYHIEGWQIFPLWKMNEIEQLLMSKNIFIDDEEVVYRGSEVFTPVGKSCFNMYKLGVDIEECQVQKIYGCNDECSGSQYIIAIKSAMASSSSYNIIMDNGIAINSTDLYTFLLTRTGVLSVADITSDPDIVALGVDYDVVYKVAGVNPILPSYMFIGNRTSRARIFPIVSTLGSSVTTGLGGGAMCDDINRSGAITINELTCDDIVYSTPTIIPLAAACDLQLQGHWVDIAGTGIANNLNGSSTLVLNIKDTTRHTSSGTIANYYTAVGGETSVVLPNSQGGAVSLVKKNGVTISTPSAYTFNPKTGAIQLTVALHAGDIIYAEYTAAGLGTNYILSGETLAIITGACVPPRTLTFRTADIPTLPTNSTLIITPRGEVIYTGAVTNAYSTYIKVGITITYLNT